MKIDLKKVNLLKAPIISIFLHGQNKLGDHNRGKENDPSSGHERLLTCKNLFQGPNNKCK